MIWAFAAVAISVTWAWVANTAVCKLIVKKRSIELEDIDGELEAVISRLAKSEEEVLKLRDRMTRLEMKR